MDITFSCDKCGQEMTIDEQYAGMNTNCVNCNEEVLIPAVEAAAEQSAPAPEPESGDVFALKPKPPQPPPGPPKQEKKEKAPACPKCNVQLSSPNDVICVTCGHRLKEKEPAAKLSGKQIGGKLALTIVLAAAAALLSGAIWGGIAILVEREFGIIAILVGAIAGGAIRLLSQERSAKMGAIAVVLAICGIMLGKFIFVEHMIKKYDEELFMNSMVNDEEDQDQDEDGIGKFNVFWLRGLVFGMVERGEAKDPNAEFYALVKEKVPLTDPRYITARENREKLKEELKEKTMKMLSSSYDTDQAFIEKAIKEAAYHKFLYDKMIANGELTSPENLEEWEDTPAEEIPLEVLVKISENYELLKANLKSVQAKYNAMSEEERTAFQQECRAGAGGKTQIRKELFAGSFGLFDILFFLLAIANAWGIAVKDGNGG